MKHITFLFLFFSIYGFSQNSTSALSKNKRAENCKTRSSFDEGINEWRDIDCYLITGHNELRIAINPTANTISKKNKKIIDRKITKLIKKEFVVLIEVHHDSKENDSVNAELSNKKANLLAAYINSLEIPRQMVWINSFGNTKSKKKCADKVEDCDKIYKANSKITYKVVSGGVPSKLYEYRYDVKQRTYYWCVLPKK